MSEKEIQERKREINETTERSHRADKEDGPVYKFYQMIRDYGGNFMETIMRQQDITLFAPSNAAWNEEGVRHILQDKERFKEILNLHFVRERLPLDKIKHKSVSQKSFSENGGKKRGKFELVVGYSVHVPTAAMWKSLYFNVVDGNNGSQTVTVEGGGVNATVITANIAATNGIIHIIDRVLGVPYTTVLDKLRTDPMLNATYFLGTRRNFNEQLNDTKKRFTYFVPSNSAWENAKISVPSTYAKLFMSDYSYHTRQILERHLVVADRPYTMKELKQMTVNESVLLSPVRDNLKLRIREYDNNDQKHDENAIRLPTTSGSGGYQIEWMGSWVHVFRPDVTCTNGIIHVIDGVFLMPDDVTVTDVNSGSLMNLTPHLIMIIVAKWLL
ncbi:hypothetical protein PV325_000871 [Microctonus aethiopoides]|nr:hypothetical protein PV325_000871 [Microctonus aethiopoides]